MDGTVTKYFENDIYTIYYLDGNYVSVSKNINSNIKTYLKIVNNNNINISKEIDDNTNNCIFYIYKSLSNDYSAQLDRIKKLVNTIYNYLLKDSKNRNDFIKKVEIIDDNENRDFINYLCNNSNGKFIIKGSNNTEDYIFGNTNNTFSNIENFVSNNDESGNSVMTSQQGSIKWYAILLILGVSLMIGIGFAIYVLK